MVEKRRKRRWRRREKEETHGGSRVVFFSVWQRADLRGPRRRERLGRHQGHTGQAEDEHEAVGGGVVDAREADGHHRLRRLAGEDDPQRLLRCPSQLDVCRLTHASCLGQRGAAGLRAPRHGECNSVVQQRGPASAFRCVPRCRLLAFSLPFLLFVRRRTLLRSQSVEFEDRLELGTLICTACFMIEFLVRQYLCLVCSHCLRGQDSAFVFCVPTAFVAKTMPFLAVIRSKSSHWAGSGTSKSTRTAWTRSSFSQQRSRSALERRSWTN